MGYVIAAVVVLLLVAGFITFFVLNATQRSGRAAPSDPGGEGTPAGIAAPDESPLGDTTEHAGDQQEGRTVADAEHSGTAADAEHSGTAADAEHSSTAADDRSGKPRVGDAGPEAPESERLADRPR